MRRRVIYLSLVLLLTGCDADVDSTLDTGEQIVRPVVVALESYRDRNQMYPDSLEALVKADALDEIPKLPEVKGTHSVAQLTYSLSPDGSFYLLRFAYDFPQGLSPPAIITRYYISDERKWRTRKYPPSFDNLVADRSGRVFREHGSFDALKTTVEQLIRSARNGIRCINLFQANVTERLGPGEALELPADLRREGDAGAVRYSSNDPSQSSYVFVYERKVMMAMNEDRSFGDREFQVVRAVFEVAPGEDGSLDWTLLAECQ